MNRVEKVLYTAKAHTTGGAPAWHAAPTAASRITEVEAVEDLFGVAAVVREHGTGLALVGERDQRLLRHGGDPSCPCVGGSGGGER